MTEEKFDQLLFICILRLVKQSKSLKNSLHCYEKWLKTMKIVMLLSPLRLFILWGTNVYFPPEVISRNVTSSLIMFI